MQVFFSSVFALEVIGDCKCGSIREGETTHWGGNQEVVYVEKRTYGQLRGTVKMEDGKPMEGAFVEIFDHPEYLLRFPAMRRDDEPQQKRLAACRTAADGKFCFRNLPSGKYELRSSSSLDNQ